MEKRSILKRLFKTAMFTSPLIALLVATPLYVLTEAPFIFLPFLILGISFIAFLSWLIQIFSIRTKPILRYIVSVLTVFILSFLLSHNIDSITGIDAGKFFQIRVINIIAINAIIYVLIQFQLSQERESKLLCELTNIKIAQLESQVEKLKSQVSPHFFFNSLSSLHALIRKNPELAQSYVVKLANFLRKGIKHTAELITVEEELDICKDYIDLQKIRFSNTLDVQVNTSAYLNDRLVPFFSIQSLIENAIKHNLMTSEKPLLIFIESESDYLVVRNEIHQKTSIKSISGTGLVNLHERLLLMCNEPLIIENNGTEFLVKVKSVT